MSASERMRLLVEQRLGMNPQVLTQATWRRSLKQRMEVRGCSEPAQYLPLLLHEEAEWQALIDIVVVPETWFFREGAVFDYLQCRLQASAKWQKKIHILSMPCSSGEEPYSIAMALSEVNLPRSCYQIEGLDISGALLQRAAAGFYGKNSFRGSNLAYRDKYFKSVPQGYLLNQEIRDLVQWRQGNVLEDHCLEESGRYDFILCRNLLIYLHAAAQKKLLATCLRLLVPDGTLIVASAELELARAEGWSAVAPLAAYALWYPSLASKVLVEETSEQKAWTLPEVTKTPNEAGDTLKKAMGLADSGDFTNAMNLCQQHLQRHVTDSNGYYLAGVIHHACGECDQAEIAFQKTVYLSPRHHEALIYLALLMEQRGDFNRGEIFRQRAQRCLNEQPSVRG